MTDFWAVAAGAGAGLAVLICALILYDVLRRRMADTRLGHGTSSLVILLKDGKIFDCTPDTAAVMARRTLIGTPWYEVRQAFVTRFPDIPEDEPTQQMSLVAVDDPKTNLTFELRDDVLRVTLEAAPLSSGQILHLRAVEAEYTRQDSALQAAPMAMWHVTPDNKINWYNNAFVELCDLAGRPPEDGCPIDVRLRTDRELRPERASLEQKNGRRQWYEVTAQPVNDGWLYFASSIDTLVEAEMAQRNFVQTLTKTFAHLPIGLAVFDKDRRLVLFNPALVDLTHLPVDFLSAKPNLLSFFDHMRENRMMPEPKSYASWREKLSDVISAASEDRYCETWTLPSGLTYKITGRPHPDGAVAFLIEDISAEISLTRRFRSELEMTQSVIDGFDDAVVVFSRLGVLTFSNTAYRERWKCDPDSAFAEVTIVDATRDWQQGCQPSPIWPELRDFVLTMQDRTAWTSKLITKEDEHLMCIIEPVAAGATMVRFSRMLHHEQPIDIVPKAAVS